MHIRAKLASITRTAPLFFLLFQVLSGALPAAAQTPEEPADAAQTDAVFTPSQLSFSGNEIVNPMRGLHEWRWQETVPAPESSPDAYDRYFWYDPDNPEESLEPSHGNYNFSALEADIARAAAEGKKFAFRIRAMGNDSGGKRYIPDYLASCGWTYNGTFIPDWNKACFLDAATRLLNALGARYDRDPRIAWVDIGVYGRWGEWAMDSDIYRSAPAGVTEASLPSLNRIVDMHIRAFPTVRKVMMAKTEPEVLMHALTASSQIGWRVDCLGKEGYFDFGSNSRFAAVWPILSERWKTAPVIAEFCTSGVDSSYQTAIKQVQDFHIASVGNGNIDSWDSKSSSQKANLTTLGKTAGYRFSVKDVTLPQTWSPGATINITARWENLGVTPHYERMIVLYKLYDTRQGAYVWEMWSSLNLQRLWPTGAPLAVVDSPTLPANLPSGSYQLRLAVLDPTGYRKPLKLAIGGLQADGSYTLGTITVNRTNSLPPANATHRSWLPMVSR